MEAAAGLYQSARELGRELDVLCNHLGAAASMMVTRHVAALHCAVKPFREDWTRQPTPSFCWVFSCAARHNFFTTEDTMSLEEKLAANTAALQLNTAALNNVLEAWNKLAGQATALKAKADSGEVASITAGGVPVAAVKPEAPKAPKVEKAEKPAATQPAADPAPAAPAPTESASASPSEVEHDGTPDAVTLEDVQAAVKKYGSTHRAQVVEILGRFGAAKASQLFHNQYRAALEAINALGEEDLS